ncbi:MAG: MgtC/SapB family protein [Candidatus Heimdallarchaeota archaeon]
MFELYICLIVLWKSIVAIVCGWLIGSERKKRDKEAGGSRTMALLCLGATFLAILSLELNTKYDFDFVRMLAYMLPAVGFIGAGVIQKNKDTIDGLTTSSTLLLVLPIGFAIGLNYYSHAIIVTILTWIVLESKYWTLRRNENE